MARFIKPYKKDLWDNIISHAHSSADARPLVLGHYERLPQKMLNTHALLVSTNPCAEQPLPDGGCCNLGAVNLRKICR